MEKSTSTDFTTVIEGMAELHEACQRNGYFIPSLSSSMVTEYYLLSIIQKEIYCPLFKDVRLAPCPKSPTKKVLL